LLELNKIYCMDCLDGIKGIPDESIDLILTDIPYNISKENNFKTMKNRQGRNGIDFGKWDKQFDIHSLYFLQRLLKKGGSLFLFHSFEQFGLLQSILSELNFKDKIVWEKTNPMPRNRDRRWISNIELASWYVKDGDKWTFNRQNDKYEGSVLRFPSESGGGFKRYHPTQKNLQMVEYIIKIHSNPGDLILDPFMGSGTTAVACINTGRNFIGFEISEEYCKMAEKRIEPYLMQQTIIEEDGDIRAERRASQALHK